MTLSFKSDIEFEKQDLVMTPDKGAGEVIGKIIGLTGDYVYVVVLKGRTKPPENTVIYPKAFKPEHYWGKDLKDYWGKDWREENENRK